MIIWLASYPRSGNTLLRTICKRCLNMVSYSDEPVHYESEFKSNPDLIGHVELKGSWEDFYHTATRSKDVFLVKTHRLPMDRQPYIYVVREGRQAIRSYQRFMKHYNQADVSLVKLILGVDVYGHWSGHYEKWNRRDGLSRLILRFEELRNASAETVARIADFLNVAGDVRPWENPLNLLKSIEPNFFTDARQIRLDEEPWTPCHEHLFGHIHGKLMRELQYDDFLKVNDIQDSDAPSRDHMIQSLVEIIQELQAEMQTLRQVCDARQKVIEELHRACQERLAVIRRFSGDKGAQ